MLALGGDGDEGAELGALLSRARQLATNLAAAGASLEACVELFDSARIQVEEALREIAAVAAGVEADPQRLQVLEARLDAYYRLARRHQVQPTELAELHQRLRAELTAWRTPAAISTRCARSRHAAPPLTRPLPRSSPTPASTPPNNSPPRSMPGSSN